MRLIPIALLLATASACVGPQVASPTAPARKPLSASVAPTGSARGPLIGQTAGSLAQLFGPPRQEAYELDARRLQWSNGRCVLDAYLYAKGREDRRVTYVDARDPDGEPVDADACAATLRAR